MKKELFYFYGRLFDDAFEGQFTSFGGEVLFLECKTRDQEAIVMTNSEGGEVVLKLGDIKKCFAVNDDMCFVFKKNKVSVNGKRCQALTLFPSYTAYRNRKKSEMVDFVSNYFNGLQPRAVESFEDINNHIHGFQFLTSKVRKDLTAALNAMKTRLDDVLDVVGWILQDKYILLYHSYVHYLQQNSARDFKALIRRSDNLPKLLKEKFACESPRLLWGIVYSFIVSHHCHNEDMNCDVRCPKVSYLKCSECGFAYYCSEKCQMENWPKHKNLCQYVKNIDMEFGKSRAVINSRIMKQGDENKNGDSPPTFKIFRKEIERALFTVYFDLIENTSYYDDDLNEFFGTKNKSAWMGNLHALQRNRYKRLKLSSKKLESQLISVYGTKSVFSL